MGQKRYNEVVINTRKIKEDQMRREDEHMTRNIKEKEKEHN